MIKEAAELVARVVAKSTGVRLAIRDKAPADMAVLRITATPPDAELDKDGKTHPHFFPVVNGTQRVPSEPGDYNWQPVLTADGIVQEAVVRINTFFDSREDAESYSLGMNDTHAWDDSVMMGDVRRNSIGNVDLSDYFFRWASQVAAGVLEKQPSKWFGCLAYNEVTDPPRDTKVNSRILPFVCIDRMMWADLVR